MKKVLLAALLVATTVAAGGDEAVVLLPKEGGWEITELVRTVTEYTGISLVYERQNPAIRGKTIEWSGVVRVPREALFRWFRAALFQQRIVVVPVGPREANQWALQEVNSYLACARPEYVPVDEIGLWKDADGAFVVTVVTLEHLTDTPRARNALVQMSTRPNGKVNDLPGERTFLITDYAPTVAAMVRALREMDEAAKNAPPPPAAPEAPTREEERRRLEQDLVRSTTPLAAQHFLNELRALDAKR